MPALRSGKVWQIWHFRVLFFNFGFEFCLHWFAKVTDLILYLFLHFRNYQQVYTYPLLLFPTFLPQAYSLLEHSRWTDRENSSPLVFFFPLSARGPTRRRNSTGLAELWGGWPIEQESARKRAPLTCFMSFKRIWIPTYGAIVVHFCADP